MNHSKTVQPRPYIVHRDTHLLVLYKPPGIATTSFGGGPCLVRDAKALDPEATFLHPSSRLDSEVSGLVTFTRTREANRALLAARAAGQYCRCYVALAATAPDPPQGSWDSPIAIDPNDKRLRLAAGATGPGSRSGKPALTVYETVGQTRGSAVVLRLRPKTGRTHQLRAHAAAARSPLLGDRHYGGLTRIALADGRVLSIRRAMLHCAQIDIPDLARGGRLVLTAETPQDMLELWQALGGDSERLTI
jgi:23S rRNA pseudouridine955/2504/2580 synthase